MKRLHVFLFLLALLIGLVAGGLFLDRVVQPWLDGLNPPAWAAADVNYNTPDRRCRGYRVPEGLVWMCDDGLVELDPSGVRVPSK